MTTYELLDQIADRINPVVGVAALGWAWVACRPRPYAPLIANVATLLAVALVYLVQAGDRSFQLWVAAGLDDSTHAGVHAAIVVSLWYIDKRAGWVGSVIALAYAALMLYQKYHGIWDLVSTAAVIVVTSWLAWKAVKLIEIKLPSKTPSAQRHSI